MPTFSADDDLRRLESPPILVEATLPDWPPLGGPVRLDLTPRYTVLVGKNGTGKSLLLEGLALASSTVATKGREDTAPPRAHFTFQGAAEDRFHFEYSVSELAPSSYSNPLEATAAELNRWTERCWRDGEDEALWDFSQGRLRLRGNNQSLVRAGAAIFAGDGAGGPVELPPETACLTFLQRVKLVKAGIPRSGLSFAHSDRSSLVLNRPAAKQRQRAAWQGPGSPRLIAVASTLLRWFQNARDRFEELSDLLRRVQVLQKAPIVDIQTDPFGGEVAQIFFDGLNLGLLSDGTLRALEILTALTGTASLVLIEEPETGIYPALLDRLLAVIESYSIDHQVVLSTHSPQVVSWARPADLRLVERAEAQTKVRTLSPSEVERIDGFLLDQGTLGEFIYSGAVDD